jgi:hypothetical protein
VTDRFQDFLIRVRGLRPSGGYPVECEAGDGGRSSGEVRIDRQALLASHLDAVTYGTTLFEALFAGPVGQSYARALGRAGSETGGRLRVRLWIEPEAAELQALPWERLYHAPRGEAIPLATSALNPFSRYTSLDVRDPQPVATRPVRMLIALSNPTDLPEGLKPLDVDTEVRTLQQALGDLRRADRVRVTVLPGRTSVSPPLLAALEREGWDVVYGPTTFDALTRLMGRHEVVHFVGHGFFRRDAGQGEGHAALYLEKDAGGWAAAPDHDLVDRVAPLEPPLPHLVFLSACESARQEADPTHPFVGLGPKLVKAGVPAVVGMQAPVPVEVNSQLAAEFYRNLLEHGVVDLALNQARLALFDRHDVDWAIPVLFSRLIGGRLFVPNGLANRVVTSEGTLEETGHGALVTKGSGAVRPERLPPPVRLLPRRPQVLGRTDEVAAATDGLAQGHPIEFHGSPGLGKTTLLRHLSFHPPASASDGVVYLPRRDLPVDDLLQAVFEATYAADGAYKPTPTQILQLLQDLRVLVAVDDADLSREDVQRLVDSIPGASVVLASAERNLWGDGRAFELKGLPQEVATALFEQELGRPIDQGDRADVVALCEELGGNPLHIIQAAARVREGSSAFDVRREAAAGNMEMGTALAETLSKDERTVLSVLAALRGAAIHPEHLAAITGMVDAPDILERLRGLGLTKTASPRFALADPGTDLEEDPAAVDDWREHLLAYFTEWCDRHRGEPGRLLEEIEPILATLQWARAKERWPEFLRLAQAVDEALMVGRRWSTWRTLLRQELEAAETLGDEPAKGRILHQLGTQAMGQDAKRSAKRYLKQALKIRKSLGDREGARVTRHNLKLLPTLLIPPFVMVTFLVLVVGTISVAGATLFTSGGSTLGLRSNPPSVAFGERPLGSRTIARTLVTPTTDPVIIASVSVDPASRDFIVRSDCAGPTNNQGCSLIVLFAPTRAGPIETSVSISYNGPRSPLVIRLSGTGVPQR